MPQNLPVPGTIGQLLLASGNPNQIVVATNGPSFNVATGAMTFNAAVDFGVNSLTLNGSTITNWPTSASLPGTLGQVLLSDGANGATVTNTPTVDTVNGNVVCVGSIDAPVITSRGQLSINGSGQNTYFDLTYGGLRWLGGTIQFLVGGAGYPYFYIPAAGSGNIVLEFLTSLGAVFDLDGAGNLSAAGTGAFGGTANSVNLSLPAASGQTANLFEATAITPGDIASLSPGGDFTAAGNIAGANLFGNSVICNNISTSSGSNINFNTVPIVNIGGINLTGTFPTSPGAPGDLWNNGGVLNVS